MLPSLHFFYEFLPPLATWLPPCMLKLDLLVAGAAPEEKAQPSSAAAASTAATAAPAATAAKSVPQVAAAAATAATTPAAAAPPSTAAASPPPPASGPPSPADLDAFHALDLRVGKILSCERHPDAERWETWVGGRPGHWDRYGCPHLSLLLKEAGWRTWESLQTRVASNQGT